MSQPNSPKNAEPILHRYDPQQPVVLPKTGDATVQPQASDKPPASGNPMTAESPDATSPGATAVKKPAADRPVEIVGPTGPEPTRYGDWERNGRVSDF